MDRYTIKACKVLFILLCLSLIGCTRQQGAFIYSNNGKTEPFTDIGFTKNQSSFRFAIISDLYGGERPGVIDVAIEQINLLRPDFVMSVGDLIDGGTEDRIQLHKEWDEFDEKINRLKAPFFYTGGNHDLTNTVMREVWKERLGPRYYHFIYQDALFLVLDSEDYEQDRMQEIFLARAEAIKILDGDTPSVAVHSDYYKMPERRTGRISPEQSEYFKKVLADNPNVKWTFLFMHKPVWMRQDAEGLSQIESALTKRNYTVINGHFHTYAHESKNNRDYIMLGTTGGSQNDKSDMAFDHFTVVTMTEEGPSLANIRLEGLLDKKGEIPADGSKMCFQASRCQKADDESKD